MAETLCWLAMRIPVNVRRAILESYAVAARKTIKCARKINGATAVDTLRMNVSFYV